MLVHQRVCIICNCNIVVRNHKYKLVNPKWSHWASVQTLATPQKGAIAQDLRNFDLLHTDDSQCLSLRVAMAISGTDLLEVAIPYMCGLLFRPNFQGISPGNMVFWRYVFKRSSMYWILSHSHFSKQGAGDLGSHWGFMIPWIQGQLIDVAVDAAARYAKGGPEVPTGSTGPRSPALITIFEY